MQPVEAPCLEVEMLDFLIWLWNTVTENEEGETDYLPMPDPSG